MNFKDVSGMVSYVQIISNVKRKYSCFIFFVGCLNCYVRDTINPVNGKTMQQLHEDTLEKICYLKEQGFHVIEMWECELKKEMERDEDMKRYFEEHELVDPLQPRDAFFGGRTNAAKLFHECKEDEEIR